MLAGRETHRSTGTRAGEVGFRHQYGEGRRLLPQTGPFAVVVRLQRLPAGWWVLGVNGPSIQITSPTRLQQISSPLTVRGTAEVYEGTLYFKVTQDRPGRDLLLGQGLVDGRASTQPGDLGTLRFRQPASTGPGWVTFSDASADGSNAIIQATTVRVQLTAAAPAPHILEVTTSPRLRNLEGWLELPQGRAKWSSRSRPPTPSGCGSRSPRPAPRPALHQAAGRGPRSQRRIPPRLALPQRPDLGASRHRGGWTGWHRWRAAVHRASIAPTLGTPPAPHHRGAGRLQWTHPGSLTPQPVRCPPRACWPRGILNP
jgi:hypothetical protein